ncbi:unnamed protein product [Oikopleura dioica]|uniref:Uncharacterized protein n=1 Tax=Oikopleura dioica TaxID=34765 RepID=E4XF83_OIKDI|nr:unnamed protein product [Oikopleura dioica]
MKIASFLYSVACSASEITTAFPYFGTTQMDLSILWGTDQPIALKSANEAFHYNQSEAKNSLPESQATTSFFEFDAWSQSTEPSFREEERDPRRKVTSFDFAFGAPTTAPDIMKRLKNPA